MMKQGESTKERIIKAANTLFYQRGYTHTSFSDIVKSTGLSKGNITYHFKSKEDILHAVIESRLQKTRHTLAALDNDFSSGKERLDKFVTNLLGGKTELSRYGCPNGTLASELSKNKDFPSEFNRSIFEEIRVWLGKQFRDITKLSQEEADSMAMDLLMRAQGICVFSAAYQDETLFETEIQKLHEWVKGL